MAAAEKILSRPTDKYIKGFAVDYSKIVFFESNRVWRVYSGGKLLDKFTGKAPGVDENFPEDWLASTTRAANGKRQQCEDEGLSFITGDDEFAGMSFSDFLRGDPEAALGDEKYEDGEGVGVLCKFLDSAVRLPIQCHPDVEFAQKHYNSNHGKAEAWLILNTREIDGEKPYLLMGFKEGVSPDEFKKAVELQDIAAMENMLHKVSVEVGDMFFIPGRFPHAIGPGVFLLEVQEPTDWVVQPERFIGDVELTHDNMWGPVSPQVGLECFDYQNVFDLNRTLEHVRLEPVELDRQDGGVLSRILGGERTGCFEIRKLDMNGEFTLADSGYVGIATKGEFKMTDSKGRVYAAEKGMSFFVPACAGAIKYQAVSRCAEIYIANKI